MISMPELNKRILHLGQQGQPRHVFLEQVSAELLRYTGCDALELRLADEFLEYVWHYEQETGGRMEYSNFVTNQRGDLVPCLSSETISERVCHELFRERYNPELKFHYRKQSILIGDSYQEGHYTGINGGSLGEETGYGGLLYLSFVTDDDIPGLLILKHKTVGYFYRDDKLIYESLAQTLGIAIAFRRSQYRLGERVKELSCLHSISKLLQESDMSLDDTFDKLVQLVPVSFQYPEYTECRLIIGEIEYVSGKMGKKSQQIAEDIYLNREKVGEITVSLTDAELDFLVEEYDLLISIAGATGALYRKLKMEEEKEELSEKLRQADRLATIGQLAAGIAHELNEPLSNILGYAQLVAGELTADTVMSQDLNKIISSSLHAREIVRKLLLFARQMPTILGKVDMNTVIEESLQIVGNRITKQNIELKKDLAEELPQITADSSQLKQVIINLVVNAQQSMPEGGIIRIKTEQVDAEVVTCISDTGMGMSAAVQKKMFLPFFTTKDQGEGTGLGMAVVHGIVKSHGGRLEVNSEIGRGTTIKVKFPVESRKEQQ